MYNLLTGARVIRASLHQDDDVNVAGVYRLPRQTVAELESALVCACETVIMGAQRTRKECFIKCVCSQRLWNYSYALALMVLMCACVCVRILTT